MTKKDIDAVIPFMKVVSICLFPEAKQDPQGHIGHIKVVNALSGMHDDYQYGIIIKYAINWRRYV